MGSSKLSLTFRIFKNDQLVRAEKLSQPVIKIGKVASAHLQVDDESVSRMHAIIEVLGDDVSLIDLGSTRGTFVNGQRINKAKLQTGDTITIGDIRIELAITAPAIEVVEAYSTPVAVPPPLPTATMTMPAAPVAQAKPMALPMTPAASTMTAAFAAEADDQTGARAVEVAAMFGDSVVSVKHCMDPKGGKVTRKTWAFMAAGAACLLSSAIAFKSSVDNAAYNKGKREYHTKVLKQPVYSFRPTLPNPGLDYLAFGGLALGLLGVTAGLARMRSEKKSPFYRVGTAPGVEQPLETAPSADFPLIAPSGDDFVFNYGAGFDGEMTVDGKSTSLAELAQSGRARPSTSTTGAVEIPIPANAKIRARSGNTTFLVSAVAKPRTQAVPLWSMENRTVAYFAGSLAVHLGVWAFLQTIPVEDSGVNIDLASREVTDIRGATTEKDDVPPPEEKDQDTGNSGGTEGQGAKMALDEGAAGKPNAARTDGHMQIQNTNREPALSRKEAVEAARKAGFLGSVSVLEGGIASLASQQDWSSGFDGANVYGPLFGSEGEGRGNFGGGVKDWGVGGGCMLPPCGVIGTGKYGTIGTGDKAGDGWGGPGTGKGKLRNHTAQPPGTTVGVPTGGGDIDKAIIRRYVKRNVDKISYCYEKKLMANPGLAGSVSVQFLIAGNGSVQSAQGTGFDSEVASCVAGVVKSINFPRPTGGGSVQVNYPFSFHAAGQ